MTAHAISLRRFPTQRCSDAHCGQSIVAARLPARQNSCVPSPWPRWTCSEVVRRCSLSRDNFDLAKTTVGAKMNRGRAAAVVITALGSIDDLSGLYADIHGAGAVEAVKMAIADFGGTVLGRNVVTLVADHQNKP